MDTLAEETTPVEPMTEEQKAAFRADSDAFFADRGEPPLDRDAERARYDKWPHQPDPPNVPAELHEDERISLGLPPETK